MLIKQLSIFVENRKGRLAEITDVIGKVGIDIRALSVADTTDFGILRLIVDQPEAAVVALKEAGVTVSLTDVIAIGLDDAPGSFAKIVAMVSAADMDIEYMYAFISRKEGTAYIIMRLENAQAGIEVLQKNNVNLISSAEIYGM